MSRPNITSLSLLLGLAILLLLSARPVGATPTTTITVDTTTFDFPLANNGNCTLIEALIAAETNTQTDACPAGGSNDTIILPAGTYTISRAYTTCVTLGGASSQCGLPSLSSKVTLQGAGAANTIITRDTSTTRVRHLALSGSAELTLTNLTLSNGRVVGGQDAHAGGSIHMRDTAKLTATNVTFASNSSDSFGGAIGAHSDDNVIHVTNSTFVSNSGSSNGGALHGGQITSLNSDFSNNQSTEGGAIGAPFSLAVTGGNFTGNQGYSSGGAIYTCHDTPIINATFTANSAYSGAALYIDTCASTVPTATIQNSRFMTNTASSIGGGIYVNGVGASLVDLDITGSYFLSNVANNRGGAVNVLGSDVTVSNTVFHRSEADNGGGIYVNGSELLVSKSAFVRSDNQGTSGDGAAITLVNGSNATLENTTITASTASRGVLSSRSNGGIFTIRFSTLTNNSGQFGTAGIYDISAGARTHTIENSIMAGNVNSAGDGAFHLDSSSGTKVLQSLGNTILGEIGTTGSYAAGVGDVTGTVGSPQSADLHTLQFIGGHWIHMPMAGGVAMDAAAFGSGGCGTTYTTDQRALTRPVNYMGSNRCDIGAAERQSAENQTESVALNEAQLYGALAVTLTDNGVFRNSLGLTSVSRSNVAPSGVVNITPLPFQINITKPAIIDRASQENINYDLTQCYTDWEFAQTQSTNEANLVVLQKVGQTWQAVTPTTVDTATNCVRLDGVEVRGVFSLGVAASPPTAVSGTTAQVSAHGGNGLLLLTSLLAGLTLLVIHLTRRVSL